MSVSTFTALSPALPVFGSSHPVVRGRSIAHSAPRSYSALPSSGAPRAYVAGRCNIGAAEIARRRLFGHLGLAATLVLLAVLLASGAPREWRFLVFFPVAGSAVGYLQAWLRFCAAFGLLGVFNFGPLGDARRVPDRVALARDRRRALVIVVASGLIGLVVALVVVLL